jgi:hypothetical protein
LRDSQTLRLPDQILDVNPASAVRGPKYVVSRGKTPVLSAEEARKLVVEAA